MVIRIRWISLVRFFDLRIVLRSFSLQSTEAKIDWKSIAISRSPSKMEPMAVDQKNPQPFIKDPSRLRNIMKAGCLSNNETISMGFLLFFRQKKRNWNKKIQSTT